MRGKDEWRRKKGGKGRVKEKDGRRRGGRGGWDRIVLVIMVWKIDVKE